MMRLRMWECKARSQMPTVPVVWDSLHLTPSKTAFKYRSPCVVGLGAVAQTLQRLVPTTDISVCRIGDLASPTVHRMPRQNDERRTPDLSAERHFSARSFNRSGGHVGRMFGPRLRNARPVDVRCCSHAGCRLSERAFGIRACPGTFGGCESHWCGDWGSLMQRLFRDCRPTALFENAARSDQTPARSSTGRRRRSERWRAGGT